MKKISVIIPTYNEEDVINDCLESLARQSYKDMEVVVVDDGSVDKTLAEIRDAKYEIRVFKQKHKGAGAARNLGVRHSWLLPEKLFEYQDNPMGASDRRESRD